MNDFAKYTYLNNYIKKFREKLPSKELTVQDLHQALYYINIKPKNGTMYERKDVDYALNFEPILNKLRSYLGIKQKTNDSYNDWLNFNPLKKQEKQPNYYSSEEMNDASNELLKNNETFYENIMKKNTIKLNENTLKKIITESVKKILKEGMTSNNPKFNKWFEAKELLGADAMLDAVWDYLDALQIEQIIDWLDQDYELWDNEEEEYEDEEEGDLYNDDWANEEDITY